MLTLRATPRLRAADRPRLHLVHGPRVDAAPDRAGSSCLMLFAVAINCARDPRQLAPQVPRLPHARRRPARAVLLGRGRRHERQRHQVRARQLPADAGHRTRLDPQRHARGRHGVRRRAEPRPARAWSSRSREWIGDDSSRASSATTAGSRPSASSSTTTTQRIGRLGHLDHDHRASTALLFVGSAAPGRRARARSST